MLSIEMKDTRCNQTFSIQSLPVVLGGNGAVAMFFAKNTLLNEDFVLKNNCRKIIRLTSPEMKQFYHHKRVVLAPPICEFGEEIISSLARSAAELSLQGDSYVTCYHDNEICVIDTINGKPMVGVSIESVVSQLRSSSEIVLLKGAAEYSRLRKKLWDDVSQLPLIKLSTSWSKTSYGPCTVKVMVIGPLGNLGQSLLIAHRKNLYGALCELNGDGLLPTMKLVLARGPENEWLKMPYGNCFDSLHKFPHQQDMYVIAQRLARANQTLLEMSPRRYCGDNKPSNVCYWDSPSGGAYYMLDTDEIPTLEELWEGGGPRCYATFQLAGDQFSSSPTLMVLYSWMATVACFCSKANMQWVYTHTCHTQSHLPHTVRALLNAITCPPKIEQVFEQAAQLAEDGAPVELLISFFDSVQNIINDDPPAKRRRMAGCS